MAGRGGGARVSDKSPNLMKTILAGREWEGMGRRMLG